MIIPNEIKNQIKSSIVLEDFIGGLIELKKNSNDKLFGVCPFHKELQPSFSVTPSKQLYYCFGCHKHGDIFSFIQEFYGCDFSEALEIASEKSGIRIPDRDTYDENWIHYTLNKKIANDYNTVLSKSPKAQEYIKSRKLSNEVINLFNIGYAPYIDNGYIAKKYANECHTLKELNLIIEKDGSYYDKFRSRIMFPVSDEYGNIRGFMGRDITDKSYSKYLNTSDTCIFNKSHTLYGLNITKKYIKSEDLIILTEGNIDVLTLFQNNVRNVIGVSGTALSEYQIKILQKLSKNICIMLDGDPAGKRATIAIVTQLLRYAFNIFIAVLPNGNDPDEYINNGGDINEIINKRVYVTRWLKEYYDTLKSNTDKSEYLNKIIISINHIQDTAHRAVIKNEIQSVFNLSNQDIGNIFSKFRPNNGNNNNSIDNDIILSSELTLLKLAISDDKYLDHILKRVKTQLFITSKGKYLAGLIFKEGISITILKENLGNDLQILFQDTNGYEYNMRIVDRAILKLKIDSIGYAINSLKKCLLKEKQISILKKIEDLEIYKHRFINEYNKSLSNVNTL